eukprot:TRINITY_DN12586_c0_g1_i1.p1 TRINITY_DN12586_c0_g1~~TRINITY_DN12586_c0_g1_i1.p1  ORF type:complete len:135 (-),score=6.25 TRINITY_DN12586_c0_g1_i1:50-454(-)
MAHVPVQTGEYKFHDASIYYSRSRILKLNEDGTASLINSSSISNSPTSSFDIDSGPGSSGCTTRQEILHGTWTATAHNAITFHVTRCEDDETAACTVGREFVLPRAGPKGFVTESIPFVGGTTLDYNYGIVRKT